MLCALAGTWIVGCNKEPADVISWPVGESLKLPSRV